MGVGAMLGPLPFGGGGRGAPRVIGSRVYGLRHQTNGAQFSDNVQVSGQIPVPSLLTQFHFAMGIGAPGATLVSADIYVSNNDSIATAPEALGQRVTEMFNIGASPPRLGAQFRPRFTMAERQSKRPF